VLREPSVVAVDTASRKVRAVGDEAKKMLGRTPGNITAIRPMKDGVIADFDVTEAMLRYFIRRFTTIPSVVPPRVVIAIPSGITEVEKRAVKESATHAGAREVITIPEPMAAAIGVGLPIDEPAANMIVDIGGGTTEIAIISLSGIVFSKSIRVAGDEFDLAIINYMKRAYNLLIGERTAEEIKCHHRLRLPARRPSSMEVKGRDSVAGLPKTIHITSQEIREALADTIGAIVDAVRADPRALPARALRRSRRPRLRHGRRRLAHPRHRQTALSEKTGLPVTVSDDPLSAVANGTGVFLTNIDELHRIAADF
jgi:rod shape-determining protein MreB